MDEEDKEGRKDSVDEEKKEELFWRKKETYI